MLTLLTCRECENGHILRQHLHDALSTLEWRPIYAVADLSTLPTHDPRRAYPGPTVLWRGRDIFGLAEPPAPYPPLT
jgi:hypothetical protein